METILVIDKANQDHLGKVRHIEGLFISTQRECIWLRGADLNGKHAKAIRSLPVSSSFTINEANLLFYPGAVTPFDKLEDVSWQKLDIFISLELPVAAMPGRLVDNITIKCCPSSNGKPGAALQTTLTIWKEYAEYAPEFRLQRLLFAVSAKDEVFIIGHPLPALPGSEYWRTGDCFIPAGFDFEVASVGSFMENKLNVDKDRFLIINTDASCESVLKSNFLPAKRSAIRLTTSNNG